MAEQVIWRGEAKCDFCADFESRHLKRPKSGHQLEAREEGSFLFDAATKQGPWATMCETHFNVYSRGMLGTGFGQKYVCDANRNFVKVEG